MLTTLLELAWLCGSGKRGILAPVLVELEPNGNFFSLTLKQSTYKISELNG